MTEIKHFAPAEIEAESFRIITEELGDRPIDPALAPILKRVIHTTADFDYAADGARRDQQADRGAVRL